MDLDEMSWIEHAPGWLAGSERLFTELRLTATRRFLIRPTEGGKSVSLQPSAGDLIAMGGRAQGDWRHCVSKQVA
jgi:alkylated DNA repair dioxygenase AlkB